MEITCEYLCGSANNVSKAVALVPEHNEIVYAICNLVVVMNATTQNVAVTLKAHETDITSVSALTYYPSASAVATELITSSEDGVVCIWSRGKGPADYWLVQTLRDMHHSVVSLHAIAATNGSLLCACDSKGNIHVWYKPFEDMEKRDYGYRSVHVASSPPSQMPNCVCAFAIPLGDDAADGTAETIMIALGGVDCRIVVTLISAADVHRAYMALGSGECAYVGQRVVGVLSGHEDWITSLSCAEVAGQLMLASGSQDSKIRLWRFARCSAPSAKSMIIGVSGVTAVDMQESDSEDDDIVEEGAEQVLQTEEDFDDEARFSFSVADGKYWFSAFLEALLVGHEDWVTSVQWVKETNGGCQLFSTSMDRNMLLWEAEAGGIWIPTVRIGDIGGNLGGSVGANLLGFVNGVITESGRSIIGIGYGGAFHLWQRCAEKESMDQVEQWQPRPFPTGHFGPVTDLSWSLDGAYLLSVSSDQTCRLHARLKKQFYSRVNLFDTTTSEIDVNCWREISRPQVHGYDLNAITCSPSVPYLYFSGGDEKVVRMFESSQVVLDGLSKLCVGCDGNAILLSSGTDRIQRAFIPALGLSNKAVSLMSTNELEEQESRRVELVDWTEPPLEGQLADHTLWPEMRKLFGHTGDIMCTAISHSGSLLATACKGRNPETSSIILWSTDMMSPVGRITSHESTVVCIRFSPNDRFIMSVSKDRGLCISERSADSIDAYHPIILHKNAHKRIIWDCTWCSDIALVTGSRDGVCKVWALSESIVDGIVTTTLVNILDFRPFEGISVTSLDCASEKLDNGSYLLAIGAESGDIKVWSISEAGNRTTFLTPSLLCSVDSTHCHGMAVKRIRWNPRRVTNEIRPSQLSFQFASCGEDKCLRVYTTYFSNPS